VKRPVRQSSRRLPPAEAPAPCPDPSSDPLPPSPRGRELAGAEVVARAGEVVAAGGVTAGVSAGAAGVGGVGDGLATRCRGRDAVGRVARLVALSRSRGTGRAGASPLVTDSGWDESAICWFAS
jgi:hypothetical protein